MIYEAKGSVVRVCKEQTFSSGFRKRGIVVNTRGPNDKYDNKVEFCATKDGCDGLSAFSPGQSVRIRFAIEGREWQDKKTNEMKCFSDLKVVSIEADGVPPPKSSGDSNQQDDGMPF